MKSGNTKEKEGLIQWYDTIEKSNKKVIAVKGIFKSSGASIASQKLVTSYTEDAFKKLESITISEQGKNLLIEFGQNLMNRKF
jgi:geranylgeranyl diphosphate synthase type II